VFVDYRRRFVVFFFFFGAAFFFFFAAMFLKRVHTIVKNIFCRTFS